MAKRPLAVLTIAQDEREFMGKWLSHYLRHVESRDIYILHHGDDSGWGPPDARVRMHCGDPGYSLPVRKAGYSPNVVPVFREESFDHDWLRETVSRFYAFLLQSYEYVLFAEADELVTPAPGPGGVIANLAEWIDAHRGQFTREYGFRATGYEVVHRPDYGEPDLTPNMDWLPCRNWWYRSRLYSKTLLARLPLEWCAGFHEAAGYHAGHVRQEPMPELLLVHLHKVDVQLALAKARRNAARRWSARDVAAGAGWQNRLTTEDGMLDYFLRNVDTNGVQIPWERIPESIKGIA
jgi:hypothetical protein